DALCRSDDTAIAVTARLVRTVGHRADGRIGEARSDAAEALRLVDADPVPHDRVHWVPGRLRDRARLAHVVLALALDERPNELRYPAWRAEALDHLDDIDAERLVAATVLLEHCWSPVDGQTGRRLV